MTYRRSWTRGLTGEPTILSRWEQPSLTGEAKKARLQLLECANLDLPNALSADAIDLAQLFKRLGLVGEAAFHQDMPLAVIQAFERAHEQVVADACLLILSDRLVLEGAVIDEEILPLAFAALIAFQRGIEAGVAAHAHAAVHRHHLFLGDPEIGGDLGDVRGLEIAFLESVDLVLHPAKVEKQLLLRRRGAHLHEAPRAQDEFLDRGANPPHCVGRETESTLRLELLHALHQADIALADQLADRQAVAAVAHGDLGHEPEVRID